MQLQRHDRARMSASPEVMQANMPPPRPARPPVPTPEAEQGPSAAGMMNPTQPKGAQAKAKVDVLLAIHQLEVALAPWGSGTKEGKAILKAITALGKAFGKDEESTGELQPAAEKQMLANLAGPGAPPKPQGPPPGAPPGGPPQMGAPGA